MESCDFNNQIEAYHDGMLERADQVAVESHLRSCAECRRWSDDLRAMSQLFAEAPRAELLPAARRRVHRRLEAVMDGGLVRLEWIMSGIAAAVLLCGSIWLRTSAESPAKAAPPWVSVVSLNESAPVQSENVTPVAQWYLSQASARADDNP